MELSSLKEEVVKEGVWFTPLTVKGKKMDISFCCLGRNTPEYRQTKHRTIQKAASGKKNAQAEAIAEGTINMLCACVTDWKGITEDGKNYPCTMESKRKLFSDAEVLWLIEQIEEFIVSDENFLSVKE